MGKLVLFMHVTADGFVGGTNGEMDWIHVDEEIFEYAGGRTNEADTALYGRKTFEMMDAYWPTAAEQPGASKHDIEHSAWYNKVTKVVLSRTLKSGDPQNTIIISKNVADEINKLKKTGKKDILIFGSPDAVHSLMAENLIDEYWLFVNPVLLGAGIPLFKNIKDRVNLTLAKHHAFRSGVVCLHYKT